MAIRPVLTSYPIASDPNHSMESTRLVATPIVMDEKSGTGPQRDPLYSLESLGGPLPKLPARAGADFQLPASQIDQDLASLSSAEQPETNCGTRIGLVERSFHYEDENEIGEPSHELDLSKESTLINSMLDGIDTRNEVVAFESKKTYAIRLRHVLGKWEAVTAALEHEPNSFDSPIQILHREAVKTLNEAVNAAECVDDRSKLKEIVAASANSLVSSRSKLYQMLEDIIREMEAEDKFRLPLPVSPLLSPHNKQSESEGFSSVFGEDSKLAYHGKNGFATVNARHIIDLAIEENHSRRTSLDSFVTATSRSKSFATAPSFMSSDPMGSSSASVRTRFQALLQRGKLQIGRPIPILSTLPTTQEEATKKYPLYIDRDRRPFNELDWCGRGMHVDFKDKETIPLQILSDVVGHGSTASVVVVQCRRIKLARKTVILPPDRRVTKQILQEVLALHRLSHSHVVRLVGTYIQKRRFATLLYPAAEMSLEEYLEEIQSDYVTSGIAGRTLDFRFRVFRTKWDVCHVLSKGSVCLTSGLRYLHRSGINHSDIKPANIILKEVRPHLQSQYFSFVQEPQKWFKMYFCDFGISRTLDPEGESQTEEDRGKTPRYASPEVMSGDAHGRASDIYSFGYVLAEMATVFSGRLISDFRHYIHFDALGIAGITPQIIEETSTPFQAYYKYYQPDQIEDWFSYGDDMEVSNERIRQMIREDPKARPRLLHMPTDMDSQAFELVCEHDDEGAAVFEIEEKD